MKPAFRKARREPATIYRLCIGHTRFTHFIIPNQERDTLSMTVIIVENKISDSSSNPVCAFLRANALGTEMNPIVFPYYEKKLCLNNSADWVL